MRAAMAEAPRRLYRKDGLMVRRRRTRKCALDTQTPLMAEADGRRFCILNVLDDVARRCPASRPTLRSRPGGWCGNGCCEAFGDRLRDVLLNEILFSGLDHARTALGSPGSMPAMPGALAQHPATCLRRHLPPDSSQGETRAPDPLREAPFAPPARPRQRQPWIPVPDG